MSISETDVIEITRRRADKEFDDYVSAGLKISDNLLLVNSAVIAILISSDEYSRFKYPILFLAISCVLSILAIYFQKELSRETSIKFRLAAMATEKANEEGKFIQPEDCPDTSSLRDQATWINHFLNSALVTFGIGFFILLFGIFCP